MRFRVLSAAQSEATQSAIWYDNRQDGLGEEFIDDLQATFEKVAEHPDSFPYLEHYRGALDVRRCLLKRFPFAVIYLRRPDEILVVAVAHARRNPVYWLSRIRM